MKDSTSGPPIELGTFETIGERSTPPTIIVSASMESITTVNAPTVANTITYSVSYDTST